MFVLLYCQEEVIIHQSLLIHEVLSNNDQMKGEKYNYNIMVTLIVLAFGKQVSGHYNIKKIHHKLTTP